MLLYQVQRQNKVFLKACIPTLIVGGTALVLYQIFFASIIYNQRIQTCAGSSNCIIEPIPIVQFIMIGSLCLLFYLYKKFASKPEKTWRSYK